MASSRKIVGDIRTVHIWMLT